MKRADIFFVILLLIIAIALDAFVFWKITQKRREALTIPTSTPTHIPTLLPSSSPTVTGTPFAYPAGLTGYAISWAQCGRRYPELPYDFGILDVTGGWSLTHNPCLKSEFEWARTASYPPTFYINLTYPPAKYR